MGPEDTQHLGFFNRMPVAADIELAIDVVQVFFYGFRRNEQLGSDFLVLQPLSQQIKDFVFLTRQGLDQRLRSGVTGRGG
jgi:hypothetical protein